MQVQLEVRILGALEVRVEGRSIAISQPKSRQLLALLASSDGNPVSSSVLQEQLWPDNLPANPRQALQVAVSRLRSSLGSCLETVDDGYRLNAWLDASHFSSSIASTTDPGVLLDALQLWRGPALLSIEPCPLLESWISRLDELRTSAQLQLADLYFAKGNYPEAATQAQAVVDHDIYNERACLCLAQSLGRSGRKADALRCLGDLRAALRSDFGVNLSNALSQAEQEILDSQVDLRPVTAPRPSVLSFVGRQDETHLLLNVADHPYLAVEAEPGAGKSRLLESAEEAFRRSGQGVISATAPERASVPLEPIITIVRELYSGFQVGYHHVAAARWILDGEASPDHHGSRDELVEGLTKHISRECAALSVVLLIDDAQWLDRTSSLILQEIVRLAQVPIRVFSRPNAHPTPFWKQAEANAEIVQLSPFTESDVDAFLIANYPRLRSRNTVGTLHRRSGGNPLLLSLLTDSIQEGTPTDHELPVNLLVAARERLASLPAHTLRVIETASVFGDEFPLDLLEQLEPEAKAHLGEAEQQGLVHLDQRAGTGQFAHGLICQAAQQLLPPVRRTDLHDAVGILLESSGQPAASYAHHFDQASELDVPRAARAFLAAGEEYLESFCEDEALESFAKADALAKQLGGEPSPLAATIRLRQGMTQRRLADDTHVATLRVAAQMAQATGDNTLLAHAVCELCRHGGTSAVGHAEPMVIELLETALNSNLDPKLHAELCGAATTFLSYSEGSAWGRELFQSAWAAALALEDEDLEADILLNTHLGLRHPNDLEERERATSRLAALAGTSADRLWEVAYLQFVHGVIRADCDVVDAAMEQMRSLEHHPKVRARNFGMAFTEAAYAQIRGDLATAETHMNHTLAIGMAQFSHTWAMGVYASLLLPVRDLQDQLGTLDRAINQAVQDMPQAPNMRGVRALVAVEVGDLRLARQELTWATSNNLAALNPDLTWTATVMALGRAAFALGDVEAGNTIYRALLPWQRRMSWTSTTTFGPIDAVLATLAQLQGNTAAVRRHLQQARDCAQSLNAKLYVARVEELAASLDR